MGDRDNREEGQPHVQERDDFEKTINLTDPDRVERAGRPLSRDDEAENVGDRSDPRVQQPGEEPPPEAERP